MENYKSVMYANWNTEIVKSYLKQIRKYEILQPEEEYAAWVEMRNGSTTARKKLINSNLRFVVSRARRYLWSGVKGEDLIQAGNIGLITATDTFDASLGVKLILFARWQIDAELQKAVNEHKRNTHLLTLDDKVYCDDDCETTQKEQLEADGQYSPDWDIRIEEELQTMKDKVKEMKELDFKEAVDIFEDYLVMIPKGYTLTDLARKYRVTEERVKDIVKKISESLNKSC